ncbi:MAG: hypothetical protein GXX86_10120, partial [Propionibacterium sp.]|nr:hypothetical protein [Propionibacterium sp.]
EIDYAASTSDLVQAIFVTGDFDTSIWSFGVPDGGVLPEMYESFHSEGGNPGQYADEEMDQLVMELQEAIDPADQKEVLEKIQARFNETIPAISLAPTGEFIAWQDNVHGVETSIDSVVLFSKAYKAE